MLISNTLVTEIGIILDIQYKQVINFLIGQGGGLFVEDDAVMGWLLGK